ncbi:unknown [Prevotella sp. CAG:5226]|nr:unknown [Prevotella sp. CAG:5226]
MIRLFITQMRFNYRKAQCLMHLLNNCQGCNSRIMVL